MSLDHRDIASGDPCGLFFFLTEDLSVDVTDPDQCLRHSLWIVFLKSETDILTVRIRPDLAILNYMLTLE